MPRQGSERAWRSRAVVEVRVPRRPGAVEGERELLVVLVLLTPHPKSSEHCFSAGERKVRTGCHTRGQLAQSPFGDRAEPQAALRAPGNHKASIARACTTTGPSAAPGVQGSPLHAFRGITPGQWGARAARAAMPHQKRTLHEGCTRSIGAQAQEARGLHGGRHEQGRGLPSYVSVKRLFSERSS